MSVYVPVILKLFPKTGSNSFQKVFVNPSDFLPDHFLQSLIERLRFGIMSMGLEVSPWEKYHKGESGDQGETPKRHQNPEIRRLRNLDITC